MTKKCTDFFLMSEELALSGTPQKRGEKERRKEGEKERRRVTAQCHQGIALSLLPDFYRLLKHVSQYLRVDQNFAQVVTDMMFRVLNCNLDESNGLLLVI